MPHFQDEIMSNEFTKYHLKGLPFDAVMHRFTDAKDEVAHDHPFDFRSTVLHGGYIEGIYTINEDGSWSYIRKERKKGDSFLVKASTIHKILYLTAKECYTIIQPEPKVQDSSFFKFNKDGIMVKKWFEKEFRELQTLMVLQ